jgi:hypothetical protein
LVARCQIAFWFLFNNLVPSYNEIYPGQQYVLSDNDDIPTDS